MGFAILTPWLACFTHAAEIPRSPLPPAAPAAPATNSAPAATLALQPAYQPRGVEGWTLHIRRELLALGKDADLTEQAAGLLRTQLARIVRVVPATAVETLRRVPLYFSPEYGGHRPTAEFHPDAGWLRANGRDPAMAGAVEFTDLCGFRAEMDRMPNFALHELAHAYHHRTLPRGFANPRILAAYERARAGGRYDRVERRFGGERPATFERAYAMTDAMEYFAETTEAFFARNDYFPFDREDLRSHDPGMFELLGDLWNDPTGSHPEAAGTPKSHRNTRP